MVIDGVLHAPPPLVAALTSIALTAAGLVALPSPPPPVKAITRKVVGGSLGSSQAVGGATSLVIGIKELQGELGDKEFDATLAGLKY